MSRFNTQRQNEAKRKQNRSRPGVESLEHRVTPTTFHVNSLLDTVAVNLKTGKDASGHISLRSAIEAANAKPNGDTIILPAGTITLTIQGTGENNDATGDRDLTATGGNGSNVGPGGNGGETLGGDGGAGGESGIGFGGGILVTGNHADTDDNDVDGTIKS
jgi:hypothetical protein